MELVARLGILALLGVLLTLRQQQQHRFWDSWDKRFQDECGKYYSTAESIPVLVRAWEKIRTEPSNPLTPTYAHIFRLLDERKQVERRDNFSGLLLLFAFCLALVWIVWL
ncbi:hypothetical protein HY635_03795 [Candidatus Uhrbacteria bacterium]|nr:hypothetical protein [Candidatus Uhrbacteria bacterium]